MIACKLQREKIGALLALDTNFIAATEAPKKQFRLITFSKNFLLLDVSFLRSLLILTTSQFELELELEAYSSTLEDYLPESSKNKIHPCQRSFNKLISTVSKEYERHREVMWRDETTSHFSKYIRPALRCMLQLWGGPELRLYRRELTTWDQAPSSLKGNVG